MEESRMVADHELGGGHSKSNSKEMGTKDATAEDIDSIRTDEASSRPIAHLTLACTTNGL